jgi:hypothetical protein
MHKQWCFFQRHMVLSILNGRQHHLDAVTIKSDFGQISVPKRPGRPPGFLAASILKACAKGGPARPARDLESLHRPA